MRVGKETKRPAAIRSSGSSLAWVESLILLLVNAKASKDFKKKGGGTEDCVCGTIW